MCLCSCKFLPTGADPITVLWCLELPVDRPESLDTAVAQNIRSPAELLPRKVVQSWLLGEAIPPGLKSETTLTVNESTSLMTSLQLSDDANVGRRGDGKSSCGLPKPESLENSLFRKGGGEGVGPVSRGLWGVGEMHPRPSKPFLGGGTGIP